MSCRRSRTAHGKTFVKLRTFVAERKFEFHGVGVLMFGPEKRRTDTEVSPLPLFHMLGSNA